uniref:TERF1-interacting nuclear factor 2 N-terminal domain-containing protein n=1 Tax=Amphiprion ocellaris TaxID=80972 RepID=A0AAQ5YPY9_AMPOC
MSLTCVPSGCLPLSSLRLLVPPVQLLSAALWQIVKQGAVEYYGLLEEFISTVLETVPELLTDTEAVQLVVGLHAKVRKRCKMSLKPCIPLHICSFS